MKAVVTGASSGIGKQIAIQLSKKGYDIIAVSRNEEEMIKLKYEIKTNIQIISMDLSIRENCFRLYEKLKSEDIEILVNNAGFGIFGEFIEIDLERELSMLHTNIEAVHILTKLFLKDMVEKDKGKILNVASIAGFMPGPMLSSYYASKAYVVRLTQGIQKELKKKHSNVYVNALCPGPVKTNFNKIAGVEFAIRGLNSENVAKYAVKKFFKNKSIIIPGFQIKLLKQSTRMATENLVTEISYRVQTSKKRS